jgi:hypothetical protein
VVGALALAASAGGATTKLQGPTVGPQAGGATAPQAVTFRLRPVAGGEVRGTATLAAVGRGTRVSLDVSGLPPGVHALSRLHAGTDVTRLSASFSRLPTLTADATGRAKATGRLLFQGREEVRLSAVADARHAIVIVLRDRVAAYGVIPRSR